MGAFENQKLGSSVLCDRLPMVRCIYDQEAHAHFVTFSCFRRRRLLDHDHCKKIVVNVLTSQLERQSGKCLGFVIMPDHVHVMIYFTEVGQVSRFMKQWKQRSSFQIKQFLKEAQFPYAETFDLRDPVWQARYYDFNVYSDKKTREKLVYMHANPVRAGFVTDPCDWVFSSARFYERGESVGVPISWPS